MKKCQDRKFGPDDNVLPEAGEDRRVRLARNDNILAEAEPRERVRIVGPG
jgi:hypothetical protein